MKLPDSMKFLDSMKSSDKPVTTKLLQSNVSNWLIGTTKNSQGVVIGGHTKENYIQSLFAPNYTVYSNTTSAQRWNDDNFDSSQDGKPGRAALAVVPIEKPHNAIHLAVGGFDVPGIANYSFVPGANGDMGENDTASFDPIFYFHHCFIDLMFWAWQLKHKQDEKLDDLIPKYPGTNSVDSQGPTPGIAGGTWLGLDTPLDPFVNNHTGKPMTSNASGTLSFFYPF
jgi:tyrosinase